jgi:hypothetical protein
MRGWAVALLFVAGCQFHVPGLPTETGSSGGGPAPTGSTPPPPTGTPSPTDLAQPSVGSPCIDNTSCGGGGLFCAHSFGFFSEHVSIPDGYCTLDCRNGVTCPAGSYCAYFEGLGQYCLSLCPPDPCRTGYTCCDISGQHGCTPTGLCT